MGKVLKEVRRPRVIELKTQTSLAPEAEKAFTAERAVMPGVCGELELSFSVLRRLLHPSIAAVTMHYTSSDSESSG